MPFSHSLSTFILFLLLSATGTIASTLPSVYTPRSQTNTTASKICDQLHGSIKGDVYFSSLVPAAQYIAAAQTYYFSSSSKQPSCVVEVSSPDDIVVALKAVRKSKSPFAVKSGGHSPNPGFSSTDGVLISLAKINQIVLAGDKKTVEIGMGNHWNNVYDALQGSGVQVVGGRVSGVGVGGLTLGGGFSWLTNQHGLTVDTVVSFNLILPNGTPTTVNASTPDLFFALKGGLNRFGIVTSVVLKTFRQTPQIWGGIEIHPSTNIPQLIAATEHFQTQNTDPKAQAILTITGGPAALTILILFHDGPNRPAAFNVFNNITSLAMTTATQPFNTFISSIPSALAGGLRGAFHTLSTTSLTTRFMAAVHNESDHYASLSAAHGGLNIGYDVEPLLPYGKFATDSAYPHSHSPLPLNLFFSWEGAENDDFWRKAMMTSVRYLEDVAMAEGIFGEAMTRYPNYALGITHGDGLYGVDNAARLRKIQKKVDPHGVMLLSGGFEI